jgi:hypothetical protein
MMNVPVTRLHGQGRRVANRLSHLATLSLFISTLKEYLPVVNLQSCVLVCVDGCDMHFIWKAFRGFVQGVLFVAAFLYRKLQSRVIVAIKNIPSLYVAHVMLRIPVTLIFASVSSLNNNSSCVSQ